MAKISSITTAVKKFYGKPMGAASKVLGVATAASVLYDAHINGREKAQGTYEVSSAERFSNQYRNYMSQEKQSATVSKMKKSWFNAQRDLSSYYNPLQKLKGYVSGFGQTLVNNLPLLALSIVSVKCKNLGKVSGTLLAVNGVKTLLYDVAGIGKKGKERHY